MFVFRHFRILIVQLCCFFLEFVCFGSSCGALYPHFTRWQFNLSAENGIFTSHEQWTKTTTKNRLTVCYSNFNSSCNLNWVRICFSLIFFPALPFSGLCESLAQNNKEGEKPNSQLVLRFDSSSKCNEMRLQLNGDFFLFPSKFNFHFTQFRTAKHRDIAITHTTREEVKYISNITTTASTSSCPAVLIIIGIENELEHIHQLNNQTKQNDIFIQLCLFFSSLYRA